MAQDTSDTNGTIGTPKNGENGTEATLALTGLALDEMDDVERRFAQVEIDNANSRAVAGVLASHPTSSDLKISRFIHPSPRH